MKKFYITLKSPMRPEKINKGFNKFKHHLNLDNPSGINPYVKVQLQLQNTNHEIFNIGDVCELDLTDTKITNSYRKHIFSQYHSFLLLKNTGTIKHIIFEFRHLNKIEYAFGS